MSFKSVLQKIGEDFLKALPWVEKGASIVTLFDPALGTLFNTTVNIVATVEQKWAALGKQSGSGVQKLADAIQIGEPVIAQGLKLAGKDSSTAAVTNYINGVVTVLNAVPATTPAA
jgi:hypothetical protein